MNYNMLMGEVKPRILVICASRGGLPPACAGAMVY